MRWKPSPGLLASGTNVREARGSSTSSVQRAATLRAHAPRQRWHWLAGVPRRRVAGTGEQRGQRSGEPTVDRYMPPCPPASQPACLSAFPRPAAASSTPGAQPPTYLSVHWPAPCIPPHDGTVQSPAAYSAERAAAASCITLHDDASWPPPPPRRPTPLHPLQRGHSARPPAVMWSSDARVGAGAGAGRHEQALCSSSGDAAVVVRVVAACYLSMTVTGGCVCTCVCTVRGVNAGLGGCSVCFACRTDPAHEDGAVAIRGRPPSPGRLPVCMYISGALAAPAAGGGRLRAREHGGIQPPPPRRKEMMAPSQAMMQCSAVQCSVLLLSVGRGLQQLTACRCYGRQYSADEGDSARDHLGGGGGSAPPFVHVNRWSAVQVQARERRVGRGRGAGSVSWPVRRCRRLGQTGRSFDGVVVPAGSKYRPRPSQPARQGAAGRCGRQVRPTGAEPSGVQLRCM